MKALITTAYGSTDVLEFREIEKPAPQGEEVLVKVNYVALNPLDWHILGGMLPVRLGGQGLFKPKPGKNILGADISGVVEAIGDKVDSVSVGDLVYGEIARGGLAEYTLAKQEHLTPIPEGVSPKQSAAVPVAGYTALQSLRDYGRIKAGQKVLINGASGGVGHYAVQLAKYYQTEVTAVCSTRNLEFVRSIGADHVIDYTKEDFTQLSNKYDLILDAVGNKSAKSLKGVLTDNGIAAVAGFTKLSSLIGIALRSSKTRKKGELKPGKKVTLVTVNVTREDLRMLGDLLQSGDIKSSIEKEYAFEDTIEAINHLGSRRIRGKVLIKIAD